MEGCTTYINKNVHNIEQVSNIHVSAICACYSNQAFGDIHDLWLERIVNLLSVGELHMALFCRCPGK